MSVCHEMNERNVIVPYVRCTVDPMVGSFTMYLEVTRAPKTERRLVVLVVLLKETAVSSSTILGVVMSVVCVSGEEDLKLEDFSGVTIIGLNVVPVSDPLGGLLLFGEMVSPLTPLSPLMISSSSSSSSVKGSASI